jgi:hypothetical protein
VRSLRSLGWNECFTRDGRTDRSGFDEATYKRNADQIERLIDEALLLGPEARVALQMPLPQADSDAGEARS